MDHTERLQELEWQYEVRLQQLKYLESEKGELFDRFNKIIYEIHQKSGLKVENKLVILEFNAGEKTGNFGGIN